MIWIIIPITAFIIILCVVVKGYTNEQAKEAALAKFREKREPTLIGIDDEDDCYDIECETSDEPLFRLIQKEEIMTENDLKTHSELYPNRNFGNNLWKASGLSSLCTLEDARSMAKLPYLKYLHGIAEITMSPEYGVMLKTPSNNCANHYTWWHTTLFDLNNAEIQYREITLQPKAI